MNRLTLAVLTLFGSFTFNVTAQHLDSEIYNRLGSQALYQQRVAYGFAKVAASAETIPAAIKMVELNAKVRGKQPDTKSAACALFGMLAQQIAEVYKFIPANRDWVAADQIEAGEAIFAKVGTLTSYCGLASTGFERAPTTIEEAIELTREIQRIAESAR